MRVIVCGVHRTGTASLRAALQQLGFDDCYHMFALHQHLDTHPQQWTRALNVKRSGKGTLPDWDSLLANYQACCDLPAALFSVELAQAYPDAKVILLNRHVDAWRKSAQNTIDAYVWSVSFWDRLARLYCCAFDAQSRNWFRFAATLFGPGFVHFQHSNEPKATAWFKSQYQQVRDNVAAARCLEYDIKHGWKPLCHHLGVPIPKLRHEKTGKLLDAPFPHVNDRQGFQESMRALHTKSLLRATTNLLTLLGIFVVLATGMYTSTFVWSTAMTAH
ncbi:hypothetical protein CDD82_5570 [Ophiocordyceps australis]|uniref:NAD dependent epimerase/dehydratase n=1 Tax=Ophiocordyceps australis TaxID=1399860 RepID=A0A2C5Z0T7_9HYPO|nr:hypothetical protein CDD82_5570 [Ophiocordyceps australis]